MGCCGSRELMFDTTACEPAVDAARHGVPFMQTSFSRQSIRLVLPLQETQLRLPCTRVRNTESGSSWIILGRYLLIFCPGRYSPVCNLINTQEDTMLGTSPGIRLAQSMSRSQKHRKISSNDNRQGSFIL